ncbi:hypothetical protein LXL04_001910 [Taraxacum kok-saghyz]
MVAVHLQQPHFVSSGRISIHLQIMSHDLDDDGDYIAGEHEVEDVENHISDDLHGADDAGGSDTTRKMSIRD